MKKLMVSVLTAGFLFVATPTPKAQAGFILLPAGGIGVIFIVLGALYRDFGLYILKSGAKGPNAKLSADLQKEFSFVMQPDFFQDLSKAIVDQAKVKMATMKGKKISISLGKKQLDQIFGRLHWESFSPAESKKLKDLKAQLMK